MMRTNQALLFGGILSVAVAGLALSQDKAPPQSTPRKLTSPHETQTPGPAKSVKAAADFPGICYLEQRDRTITVKAGPKGPVYSVKSADGKVLYENLSIEQLSAQAPKLGEFLKTAVAGAPGAKTDAMLHFRIDASMRQEHANR
jgi:hypothetical protein